MCEEKTETFFKRDHLHENIPACGIIDEGTYHTMQEIKTTNQGADVSLSQSDQGNVTARGVSVRGAREPIWGALLFACMLLFVFVSISGIGWVVYSQWRLERVAENQPSIATLPEPASGEQPAAPETESAPAPESKAESSDSADATASAQKLTMSVLNGGGAKGSAGVLAELLKKDGYLKAQPGNTLKDYTGVTVYYATDMSKEAEVIKASVAKKYPQVTSAPADTKNKETSVSQITIIIGK